MINIPPNVLHQFPCVSMLAYTGRALNVEKYPLPVVVDFHGLEIPKQNIPLLLDHKLSQIVGLTMKIEIVHRTLVAFGVVDVGVPDGQDVWRSGLLGFPWRASIGAAPHEIEHINEGRPIEVNGRPLIGPCFVMRRANLLEISLVDSAADSKTLVYFHPPKSAHIT